MSFVTIAICRSVVAVLLILVLAAQARAGVSVTEGKFHGLRAITLDCPTMSVTILPDRGANIISIKDKRVNREWMWQNPFVDYKLPAYDADYMRYDISGFDDCFPTVGASAYPDHPWKGTLMPDHGELWALPWDYEIQDVIPPGILPVGATAADKQVRMSVRGIRLPYQFEKTLKLLEPDRLEISYKVTNPTPMRMKASWAGHALVAIEPGMEVFLPGDTQFQAKTKPWTAQPRNGLVWMKLGGPETDSALKVYTNKLTRGFGGFRDPKSGDFLAMLFSPKQLPYIGLWIDQGLKLDDKNTHYNAAVEPANGGEDYKFNAANNMQPELRPKSIQAWNLTIQVGRATEEAVASLINSR